MSDPNGGGYQQQGNGGPGYQMASAGNYRGSEVDGDAIEANGRSSYDYNMETVRPDRSSATSGNSAGGIRRGMTMKGMVLNFGRIFYEPISFGRRIALEDAIGPP
jgi:hypothetical protein